MPRYLGPAWLAAAAEAADQAPPDPALAGVDLVVWVVVTGGPDGDVSYSVRAGAHGVSVTAGEPPDPTVRLSTDHETAASIAAGMQSAQAAFMAGRLRVGGDLQTLVTSAAALEAVTDVFAGVRPTGDSGGHGRGARL